MQRIEQSLVPLVELPKASLTTVEQQEQSRGISLVANQIEVTVSIIEGQDVPSGMPSSRGWYHSHLGQRQKHQPPKGLTMRDGQLEVMPE